MQEVKWPRVSVRPARPEELPELQFRLREQGNRYEMQDLSKTICYVAEYDGKIVGFTACRPMWQVEPLLLVPEFTKDAPGFAQAKATALLIKAVDGWIADRTRNQSGIHWYFCAIVGRTMRKLAVSFGMVPVYTKAKFFGRDT